MSELKPSTARNWTEDAGHENGNYECMCSICDQPFIGHKRRSLCKLCAAMMEGARLAIEAAARACNTANKLPQHPDACGNSIPYLAGMVVCAEAIRNLDLATIIKGANE